MQHSPRFLALVEQVKQNIRTIKSQDLLDLLQSDRAFFLLDVRDAEERQQGYIPCSQHISKGTLERDIEKKVADVDALIVVYCSGGFRSALAAENLQRMGYTQVYSLEGGSRAWNEAGLLWESK